MFELFVGIDTARRRTEDALEVAGRPTTARTTAGTNHGRRRRRAGVRSVSASALRSLAERLEPSPSVTRPGSRPAV
jgi:hypothetical protein